MCPACFNILALIALGAISGLTALVPRNLPVKTGRKTATCRNLGRLGRRITRANRKHLGDNAK
jgi:hypothetical protein